jgi:type I restriction enzyme S subunit
MNYKVLKIEDILVSVSETKKITSKKIIFLNTSDIEKGKIIKQDYMEVSKLPGQAKKSIKNGDILYSEIRPKNGRYCLVNGIDEDKYVVSTKLMVLRCISNTILNEYLYYYLTSKPIINYLQGIAESRSGTFPQITFSELSKLKIKVPDIKYQIKIVEFIKQLDSKIELNSQIISNLEELASTLFNRWFVDFEFPDENGNPYKSSGGKMVDSELGEIPEGWEITELKSIVDVVDNRGKTPPLEKDKTDFPIIDVKTLSGNGRVVNYNKAQKYVSEETYSSWFRSGHPKINDILISTVGSIGEIKMFLTDKGTIAQNVVGLRAKKHLEYHLYQFLLYNKSNLITYNIGSVQPSIKVTHLLKHKVLLPNKKDLNKFNSVMIGLTDKIINLSKEINSLTEIRDSLLPKLLSGEIELTEDEGV